MMLSAPRHKRLVTYSKKSTAARSDPNLYSPTAQSADSTRAQQRQLVTLTSPARDANIPSSPQSVSLSSPFRTEHQVPAIEPEAHRRTDRRLRHLAVHELTLSTSFSISSGRSISPLSSSEDDPISDVDLLSSAAAASRDRGRLQRKKKPRTLTKMRKSLRLRPTVAQNFRTRPQAVLSAEVLKEVERGADGFIGLDSIALREPKRTQKRQARHSSMKQLLEVRKGPHPSVEFDDVGRTIKPGQLEHQNKNVMSEVVESIESTTRPISSREEERQATTEVMSLKSFAKSPDKASLKDKIINAQLSSISAPIRRHLSHDTCDEKDYEDCQMAEAMVDDGYEQERLQTSGNMRSAFEQRNEVAASTRVLREAEHGIVDGTFCRGKQTTRFADVSPSKSWISETELSTAHGFQKATSA